MKILFITTMGAGGWGGSEDLWAGSAHAAIDDGHEVAIVSRHRDPEPRQFTELRNRGAWSITRSRDQSSKWTRLYERKVRPLPGIVRWKPDVVCVSQGTFYELTYRNDVSRWLETLGVPYVIVIQHNIETPLLYEDQVIIDRQEAYFGGAYRVAFVAEQNRRAAERQLAFALPNACVVRNPAKVTDPSPAPWPSGLGEVIQFACVGRLETADKGQDILLDVLGGDAWRDRPWRLSLFGSGINQNYLERLARFRGIADRVEFRGFVGDIRSVWAEHHMLVMPSRAEGTPLSLVEAMLCGRPSVVTDVGGNFDWVEEPRNGFRAEAPTVHSFGSAMERAWAARDSWEAIGQQAWRDASSLVDPSPGRSLLKLVLDAASSRQPARSAEPGTAILVGEPAKAWPS
jgi:glycosyltransferase involved in cell wall biosynthesis